MCSQFIRIKPIQAFKLTAIIAALLFAAGGISGVIPDQGFNSLFVIIFLSIGLTLVIAGETLLASYRSIRTGFSLPDLFADRQLYTVIRAIEVVSALLATGGLVSLIATLPDEPPAGPGAIGLLFIVAGLGLVVLGGCLVRTLTEYYCYRSNSAM